MTPFLLAANPSLQKLLKGVGASNTLLVVSTFR